MSDRLPYLSPPHLAALVSLDECVEVLERSLREGSIDPEADSPRLFSDLRAGEFLLMPTEGWLLRGQGAHDRPRQSCGGSPHIQGVYAFSTPITFSRSR